MRASGRRHVAGATRWALDDPRRSARRHRGVSAARRQPPGRRLAFEAQALTDWDSRLLTLLRQVLEACTQRQIVVEQQGLRKDGYRHLLALAAAVPERASSDSSWARALRAITVMY